jgi:hypothetical protein
VPERDLAVDDLRTQAASCVIVDRRQAEIAPTQARVKL